MMNNNNLGGNLRLLFADSYQIVLFLQTSRLNQSKTIPKGQDISSVLFKKRTNKAIFIQSLLTSLKVSLTILANSLVKFSLKTFRGDSNSISPFCLHSKSFCFKKLLP